MSYTMNSVLEVEISLSLSWSTLNVNMGQTDSLLLGAHKLVKAINKGVEMYLNVFRTKHWFDRIVGSRQYNLSYEQM